MRKARGNYSRMSFDSRGVFVCVACGRRCRQVDQLGSPDWCAQCDELAMLQNGVFDGCPVAEQVPARDKLVAKARKGGGDPAKIALAFPRLFPPTL